MSSALRVFGFVLCLLGTFPSFAAEPAVREGLILWFDAGAQPAMRAERGLPGIGNLQPVDVLLDRSSSEARARQFVAERRPQFITDGAASYLKFDGQDDFLALSQGKTSRTLTVCILAAPKSNPGNFSGFFGAGRSGLNDYTTGINIDFGPAPSTNLSVLNVESSGTSGWRDLLTPGFFNAAERPFGDFHVFTVRVGETNIECFLDGLKGGERERAPGPMALDEVMIGARYYSNDPSQPAFAQGSFDGMISEVLVYDRALGDSERSQLEGALLEKTPPLQALLHGTRGHTLETLKNPPPVQVFVPGFAVRELPLQIGNLNNVRYRADGKVVGLGYDGRIYLLSDTDGDGLEDRAEFFWDQRTLRAPIGMALLPANDPRGDGVLVSSKGKVSLILDRDRDGRADEEIIVAGNLPESFHGVDTVGLALAPDGSIYFGMGCANFVDAYLIDKTTGQSHYDLNSIRGTIQRISPDYSTIEPICTGVRFTCALALNRDGELFATDQEGATWLPNGNPLDELLHIEKGRHYGFPPRHPKHLPQVIDTPAVSVYAPQHQSTVGMVFNEGINGGRSFGPAHWEGDALVAGASRGKIWRTRLAKTPHGYVAQNHQIVSMTSLTIDCCVSPAGDLLVASHSGPPDWGTGPAGIGHLFKIRYARKDLPQPVLAWASAPDEFRVAFDRPMEPADWAHAREQVRIEAGEYVGAGDRFEVIRPGYQVVRDQMASPRRWVEVLGLTLTSDRRTLVLRVPRQTDPVNYAITLPLPERWRTDEGIFQEPQIDVVANLNGLDAVTESGGQRIETILPHPSLAAARVFGQGSADHEAFLRVAEAKGATLSLGGWIDVANPFVPATQPGSKLDWDIASDSFATTLFDVQCDEGNRAIFKDSNSHFIKLRADFKSATDDTNGLFLIKNGLTLALSSTRSFVPWAKPGATEAAPKIARNRDDVHGNWLRGRRLFFGPAACGTCHTIRDEGTVFGPDLSNLVFRDRDSVINDIVHPSATINPDHAGSLVTRKDGESISGLIRSLDPTRVVLALPAGAQVEIDRKEITAIEPMKTSLMPEGFADQIPASAFEDLLTFLLTNPLEPAAITRVEPSRPAARTVSEMAEVLGRNPRQESVDRSRFRILLCAGPKDHGIDEHDYPLWLERWKQLLGLADGVQVATANGFPANDQLESADVAVFFNANPGWDQAKAQALDRFHDRGGGAVYLHYAIDGGPDPAGAAERFGMAFTLGSRFRHGEFDLIFQDRDHPITRGFPTLHFTDETYWKMRGDLSRLRILGTAQEEGEQQPQLWTMERKKSRIVGCIPGHYVWTFDDPLFRVLVLRAICWAGRRTDVDQLAELAIPGAYIRP